MRGARHRGRLRELVADLAEELDGVRP